MKILQSQNVLLQIIYHLFIILIRFISFGKCDILTNCIQNHVHDNDNNSIVPTCQILNNNSNSTSFHCIEKWNNTIFIERGGDITIDCWAKFPIDMDYDGVLPIANLKLSFYKRIDDDDDGDGNSSVSQSLTQRPSNYGIKLHIIERELSWSGNYIFYNLFNPNNSIMISVFSQKNDLPIFLPLKHEKPLDAYLEDENLVIPCRVTNYNVSVKLYHDFVPVKIDNENVWYDPRKGFIRVRSSEETFNGEYECMAKWHGVLDRIKVIATKIPGESEESDEPDGDDYNQEIDEKSENELRNLTDTISFIKVTNNTYSASCNLPENDVDLDTLAFTNILSENPTYSRLARKCLGFEHTCDNHRQVGIWEVESPIPIIDEIYTSGLIKCFDSKQQEVIEYFTGTDNELYYDWEKAVEKNAIVKVESLEEPNQNFTANKKYGFICKFPHYVAASGSIWWNVKFSNEEFIESIEASSIKYINMQLNISSITCGMSLWNSTNWYSSSVNVQVLEEEEPLPLPIFVVGPEDTQFIFKEHDLDQVLKCQVLPEPKVNSLTWYKDNKTVENLPTFQNETVSLLYFSNVTRIHEGNYTCIATLTNGNSKSEFMIEVKVEQAAFALGSGSDESKGNSANNEILEVEAILGKAANESTNQRAESTLETFSSMVAQENIQKNSSIVLQNNSTIPMRRKLRRRKVKYVVVHTVEEKKCFIDEFDHYSATLAVRMRKLTPKQFAVAKIEIEKLMLDIEFPVSSEAEDDDHDHDDDNGSVHSTAKLVRI